MKLKSRKAAALLIFFFVLIVGTVASTVVCLANDYCTIRVDYKYSDGSVAHDPYVAVLTYGDEVNLSVKNPIIPGYKPVDSLEAQAESAATTVLNYPSLDDDKTITVYYVPDLVHYRVRYFKQNVCPIRSRIFRALRVCTTTQILSPPTALRCSRFIMSVTIIL